MDLSPLNDFFSNIKDKLTNPFFGTLIIVWLTRNWEPVYSIFNFDSTTTLAFKLLYIKQYFASKNFWEESAINVGLTILFILIGYVLIVGTRALSMIVEHKTMPWITKKVVSKKTVLKTVFDEVKKERDEYSDSYENERKKVREFSKDYTQQLSENEQLRKDITEKDQTNTDLTTENSKFKDEINRYLEENKNDAVKINSLLVERDQLNKSLDSEKISKNKIWLELYNTRQFFEKNDKTFEFLLSNEDILNTSIELIKNKEIYLLFNTVDKLNERSSFLIPEETLEKLRDYRIIEEEYGPIRLSTIGDYIYKYIFNNYPTLHAVKKKSLENKILSFKNKN